MKRELYSDVTARILQSMEAGVMPWERAWQSAGSSMPMNAVTDRPYSGVNVLLFWLSADCGYAIFTAASKASKAAEYLRGLAIAEPLAIAA